MQTVEDMEKKLVKNTFTLLIININHRITFIINRKSNAVFIQSKRELNKPYLHHISISSSFFFSIFFFSPYCSLLPKAYPLLLHYYYYYCYYIPFFSCTTTTTTDISFSCLPRSMYIIMLMGSKCIQFFFAIVYSAAPKIDIACYVISQHIFNIINIPAKKFCILSKC